MCRVRQLLSETQRSLEDMRDMSASRASLSGVESPATSRLTSPDGSDIDSARNGSQVFASFNGFDVSSPSTRHQQTF